MNRIRIKICGITRAEDGVFAAYAGADAIGLVFYEESPRFVSIETAHLIISVLPPFITKVGLFVNASSNYIHSVLTNVNLDMLQFHGDEEPSACEQFGKPWLKAVRMKPGLNLLEQSARFDKCAGLLLDSCVPGKPGGTGQSFDWNLVPDGFKKPLILAGGLDRENIAAAIRQTRPYAVDVSSGVESSAGIKDPSKVAGFIRQVRETNCE